MSSIGNRVNPKNWIRFVNFAMVSETPSRLRMRDCQLPYLGSELDPDEFAWGVYGNTSANNCLFAMKSFGDKLQQMPITVQGWYRVENFEQTRLQTDEKIANATGFLHLGRLKSAFRKRLHAQLVAHGELSIEKWQQEDENLSLWDLLIKHPALVQAIFVSHRQVNMVVHPVIPSHDACARQVLTVATMRRKVGKESPIMAIQARYLENQITVVA